MASMTHAGGGGGGGGGGDDDDDEEEGLGVDMVNLEALRAVLSKHQVELLVRMIRTMRGTNDKNTIRVKYSARYVYQTVIFKVNARCFWYTVLSKHHAGV